MMISHKTHFLALIFAVLLLGSCSEYQRVLKSADVEYKERMALKYYNVGKCQKAHPLFDELLTLHRGTAKAEDTYFYYAKNLYCMEDYLLAGYHFKTFHETFPNSPFREEAMYMAAYCNYLESPSYSLDQEYTYKAINAFQMFVNRYPLSERVEEANGYMDVLRKKLEKKSFEIGRLYYHTERFQAAKVALGTTLNEFPDTRYREEALYLILDASYKLADNSIADLQYIRFRETVTAYYDLVDAFPDSEYRKNAERIFARAQERLTTLKP